MHYNCPKWASSYTCGRQKFVTVWSFIHYKLFYCIYLDTTDRCTNFFINYPRLDGLPLPTTPSTGCQVLDSWRVPATETNIN